MCLQTTLTCTALYQITKHSILVNYIRKLAEDDDRPIAGRILISTEAKIDTNVSDLSANCATAAAADNMDLSGRIRHQLSLAVCLAISSFVVHFVNSHCDVIFSFASDLPSHEVHPH